MELFIMLVIGIFVVSYRQQNGENVYKFIANNIKNIYNKYAPYSYQEVSQKSKELGQEYGPKEYVVQVILIGGLFLVIGYIYFYSIVMAILYMALSIMFIPYLAYLKNKRVYSEFIFEEIQVYCSNVINEFNTTQSFVKALEGVVASNILEDPVLTDVVTMINMSYQNGTIDEAVEWFNQKYPYYMVKNMHQLFLQVTKEGAKDSGESFENMMLDIDLLVEGVYRDKMDREASHKKFVMFGIALYFLVMLIQTLLDKNNYKAMLSLWYVQALLHIVIIINSYFIISGEKFYNEDTGVE